MLTAALFIAVWIFGLFVGYAAACLLFGGHDTDLLNANHYLQEEVKKWQKECEKLEREKVRPSR